MHQITLRALMNEWNTRPGSEPYLEDVFSRMIDGMGYVNAHIGLPTNSEALRPNRYERIDPLDWDTPIYGDYLYLEYRGHDPSMRLYACSSLCEATNAVLSPAGFLNVWTDDVMVVEFGKRKDFVIRYVDRHGTSKTFSKDRLEPTLQDDKIGTTYYHQVRLEWT